MNNLIEYFNDNTVKIDDFIFFLYDKNLIVHAHYIDTFFTNIDYFFKYYNEYIKIESLYKHIEYIFKNQNVIIEFFTECIENCNKDDEFDVLNEILLKEIKKIQDMYQNVNIIVSRDFNKL